MLWLVILLSVCAAVVLYAYVGYPALLWLVARVRRAPELVRTDPTEWPRISITLPAYNAEATLRPVLEALTSLEYPADRRQILVVSDGSTDGTDDLVRAYSSRGVELLRIEGRLGKTEVENRAMDTLTGEIIVNTDASVTLHPEAVSRLVRAFGDPRVGVASARDVSVASVGATGHASEAAYVGYEMWLRDLETAVEGIIGSSGCLYAIRRDLHRRNLPGHLSRDFSSAMWARMNGFRAVSVRDSVCFVPRAASMQIEYRRKIRTMSRGLQTLFFHGVLLHPLRYGTFSWMLWSHKLVRWLVPWAIAASIAGWLAAIPAMWARGGLLALVGVTGGLAITSALGLAAVGWRAGGEGVPKIASTAAYVLSGTFAGLVAWIRALRDQRAPVWEPTPRAVSEQ